MILLQTVYKVGQAFCESTQVFTQKNKTKLKTVLHPVSVSSWTQGSFAFTGSPAQRYNRWATAS